MIEKHYFDKWAKKIKKLAKEHPLRVLFWQATLDCNSSCEYCSNPKEIWDPANQLNKDQVINIFKTIYNDFKIDDLAYLSITGGEPLLRSDLIEIISEINSIGYNKICLQTNGLIIADNPFIIDDLIDSGVTSLGVNIDGNKNIHNSIRNNSKSFGKALKTAKLINEKDGVESTIATVVNKKNINYLHDIKKIVYGLSPTIWRISHFDPIGRGVKFQRKYELNGNQYKKLFNFIEDERIRNIDNKGTPFIEFACGGWTGFKWEGIIRPFIFHCTSGLDTMTILYDGNITGCPTVSRNRIQGDAINNSVYNIWNNKFDKVRKFKERINNNCNSCSCWKYCHGGPKHLYNHNLENVKCIYSKLT